MGFIQNRTQLETETPSVCESTLNWQRIAVIFPGRTWDWVEPQDLAQVIIIISNVGTACFLTNAAITFQQDRTQYCSGHSELACNSHHQRGSTWKNLFSKHNYLKMRRVSQDKLKPTKLALQLNEEGKKTQKGGLSIKKTPLHSLLEIIASFLCPPSLWGDLSALSN